MSAQEEWISVQEASARFGIAVETIRLWIRTNKIKARVRELGREKYEVDAIEIAERTRPKPLDQNQRRNPLPPAIFPPPARIE